MKENNYIVVNCSESKIKCVTPDYIVVNHSESNEKHVTSDYTKGKEYDEPSSDVSYYGYWDF